MPRRRPLLRLLLLQSKICATRPNSIAALRHMLVHMCMHGTCISDVFRPAVAAFAASG